MRVLACMLAIAAAAAVPAGPGRAAAPPVLTVWVSPAGSDAAAGTSPAAPFATLQHASDWLCRSTVTCAGRGRPVEVRIAQAAFRVTRGTTWRYHDPAWPATLEPWSYRPGDGWPQVSARGGYPTFDGGFAVTSGLLVTGTGNTRLTFRYLRWQRFTTDGLNLTGAGGVTIYGASFYQVGNAWRPAARPGYGAIITNRAAAATIVNSHFTRLMNTPAGAGGIHGIYLGHHSDSAVIRGNEFTDITGDAVRVRDASGRALVTGNRFTRAGQHGYASDWYCQAGCSPPESPSRGGRFTGNTLHGLYPEPVTGRRIAWCYDQPAGACPAARWAVS